MLIFIVGSSNFVSFSIRSCGVCIVRFWSIRPLVAFTMPEPVMLLSVFTVRSCVLIVPVSSMILFVPAIVMAFTFSVAP